MHRCHSWISPLEVQRRISTGSGRLRINRAVDRCIEFILMIFRLYPLTAVGVFPGELQTDQVFIRVRHLGRDITDKNIFKADSEFYMELKHVVEVECRLKINEDKTRIQNRKYRQEVTGLVVNKKVNVTKRYVKQIRMWLYLWETYGYEKAQKLFIHDYLHDKGHVKPVTVHIENVLSGKLDYLKMVVGDDCHTYTQLRERYDKLLEVEKKTQQQPHPLDENSSSEDSSITELLKILIEKL